VGDAVLEALAEYPGAPVYKVAVRIMPGSGKPDELVEQAGLSANAIARKIKEIVA
jgi:transketolase